MYEQTDNNRQIAKKERKTEEEFGLRKIAKKCFLVEPHCAMPT